MHCDDNGGLNSVYLSPFLYVQIAEYKEEDSNYYNKLIRIHMPTLTVTDYVNIEQSSN